MHIKVKTWLRRYLPAEFFGTVGAVFGGLIIHRLFNNPVFTAFGGAWGENIGYYGTHVYVDLKKRHQINNMLNLHLIAKTLRNLVLEFGLGEYLDIFARPFVMYVFPIALHNVPLGLIVGKFAADFLFYIPTIVSYELRNKYLGE